MRHIRKTAKIKDSQWSKEVTKIVCKDLTDSRSHEVLEDDNHCYYRRDHETAKTMENM